MSTLPHVDFHEIWWIYSPINEKPWAGLRIAHFRKANDVLICYIQGETDPRRIGPRDWKNIQQRELWYQVKQIRLPTMAEIISAAISEV